MNARTSGQGPGDHGPGDQGPRRDRTGHVYERAPKRRAHPVAAWIAALLLAAVTAVVACRATDTDAVTPVPQLLAFWPWLIAPAVLALLLAGLARSRTGLVWALAAVAVIAWYMEPYGRVSDPHGLPVAELRVLTSNVEYGRGTPALIGAVRREHPDVVFVEECDSRCFRAMDEAFGAPAAAWRGKPQPGSRGTYPYRREARARGSHGGVILSRYPLTPGRSVPGTAAMPGATATVGGHSVRLQLAHLVPPVPRGLDRWRTELGSLRGFAAAAVAARRPTILAGDFNATQDHAAFRRILDTGLRDGARLAGVPRAPSWPARTAPALGAQIDHVLVSTDFSAGSARFLKLPGTDHRALVTDLTLHGARRTSRPAADMEPASPGRS